MAEELQSLLDRIQKDAVDTADQKAAELISQAKEKAASIIKDSEAQAKQNLEKADADAQAFAERSTRTLEQASRDLLISIGGGVQEIFAELVKNAVSESMKPAVIEQMLVKLASAYAEGQDELSVMLSEEDKKNLTDFFAGAFKKAVKGDVQVCADSEVIKGFKVSLKGNDVYNDFTEEAVAESLMHFLRPQLAEIVFRVASKKE